MRKIYYNMFNSDLNYKSAGKSHIYTRQVPELMIYSIFFLIVLYKGPIMHINNVTHTESLGVTRLENTVNPFPVYQTYLKPKITEFALLSIIYTIETICQVWV